MANIEERVEELVRPIIQELGYQVYDVQYVKEASNYFLRIFIEKEEGTIDLNDCEKVNNGVNDILDEAEYIKEQYFLEISSTGVEKVLRKEKHLQEQLGNKVNIKLFKPIEIEKTEKEDNKSDEKKTKKNKKDNKDNKLKEIEGTLKKFDQNEIIIQLENEESIHIDRKDISMIKTVFDWNEE